MSLRRLIEAGYVYIGLDHFAKPDDGLAKAMDDGSLHRNFQGYTTRAECDLIALGLSAIGKLGKSYVQNLRTLDEYYAAIDQHQLPVEKGIHLSDEDVLRRQIILDLMCGNGIDFAELGRETGRDLSAHFADEIATLRQYEEHGLLQVTDDQISVLPKGRFFVRAFGMVFDAFLQQQTTARYSKLI